jgi:DNA-binding transcriptional MerR regulator
VTLRTLRFYEDRGLVVPSRQGTTRLYTAGDRALFAAVFKAKQLGFSLAEIEAMLKADEPRSTFDLDLSLERIDAQIVVLEQRHDNTATAILELKRERAKLTAT